MSPSLTYPRDDKIKPTDASGITLPGALQLVSQSGVRNFRSTTSTKRAWTETYDMVRADDPVVRNWLAFLRRAWNQGLTFNIKHLHVPGSGKPPNGSGDSGVTISGASQTGELISTTGWTAGASPAAAAGDLIRIAGLGGTREIYQDSDADGSGNATLRVNPPIFEGSSPADGASVTTTDVNIWACLNSQPQIPSTDNALYYSGIEASFAEVTNA